jgi:NAD+ synthase
MSRALSIVLSQLNQSVGALAANADAMLGVRVAHPHADLILFPELQLPGYPAEDLVLKPAFAQACEVELARMAAATADGGPAMLVGTLHRRDGKLYNAVALLDGGETKLTLKQSLPNYGTFDEKRVFAHGEPADPFDFRGVRIGVPICEDIWAPHVCDDLRARGAELLLIPNGSPFEHDKDDRRLAEVRLRVGETGLPMAFLNRVGGQDEIVFDGASFVVNPDGEVAVHLPDWEESSVVTNWTETANGWRCEPGPIAALEADPADLYHAMLVGLRDYVNRAGFPGVILGLSGGIDSHLSAAVAVDALGADRVRCVMLPSRYTSQASLDDAAAGARMLGVRYDIVSIAPGVEALDVMLADAFAGTQPGLAEENIQSRLRMVTLMALSNRFGHMLLTTGNKSEMATGYATLYGDMAGGYSVLKDAYKTQVFALARWRNAHRPRLGLGPDGLVMPQAVITKPPSAELRPDQKDSDSLPPYDALDAMLHGLVDEDLSVDEVAARDFDRDTVARVERLLIGSEHKRRQAPPGVKLGHRNFGRDRRYPLSNAFRTS